MLAPFNQEAGQSPMDARATLRATTKVLIQGSESNHASPGLSGSRSGRLPGRLSESLSGSLWPSLEPNVYLIVASYAGMMWPPEHRSDGSPDMNVRSAPQNISRMWTWTRQLSTQRFAYCDYPGSKLNPPNAQTIRGVLQARRESPTLIYLACHTIHNEQRTFLPSDCIENSQFAADRVITYSEARELIFRYPSCEPLLLVTEACDCDNVLQLPYIYWCDDTQVQCKKTEYYGQHDWELSDVVHFAATTPEQTAIWFESTGGVFTQAFYNIPPADELSLGQIVEGIQHNMNRTLDHYNYNSVNRHKTPRSQTHFVYASREMNDPHFFKALGFHAHS